jgi:hypothetical protein
MKSTSRNWKKRPGSFDPLHADHIFSGANDWGIPDVLPQPSDLTVPEDVKAYGFRQKIRTTRPIVLHFFLEDYRFEIVWNEPIRGVNAVKRDCIWAACSPDFSLWSDQPLTLHLWNTYRSRWVARFWQQHGVIIIPSINWSTPDSYAFCFLGIPPQQIVTMYVAKRMQPFEREYFLAGYQAMLDYLQPRHIIWFGDVLSDITDTIPKTLIPAGFWTDFRQQERRSIWADAV